MRYVTHAYFLRRLSESPSDPSEILRPVRRAVGLVGQADADRDARAVEQVGPVAGAVDPAVDHVLRGAVAPRDVFGRGARGVAGGDLALHEAAAVRAGVVEEVLAHHVGAVLARGGDEPAVDPHRAAAVLLAERVGQGDDLVLDRGVRAVGRDRRGRRGGRGLRRGLRRRGGGHLGRGGRRRLGGRLLGGRLLLLFLLGAVGRLGGG